MCTLYTYTNTRMPRFSPYDFFGPSRCFTLPARNPHAPAHARPCNGAENSLPWKLLRNYLESCASIVQAVVCRPLLLPLLLSRPIPSPDAVQARSTNLSKSMLAHDVVAAAVSHKRCSIIRIGAGLIQFVYGSHSRLSAELIYQRKNIFALVFRVLRIIKFT